MPLFLDENVIASGDYKSQYIIYTDAERPPIKVARIFKKHGQVKIEHHGNFSLMTHHIGQIHQWMQEF